MDDATAAGKLVFTFPGQGSFHAQVLEELFQRYPYRSQFDAADRISRRILGHEFLPLASGNPSQREQALKACPSLDQVAIYVTNVLIADLLMNAGLRPDLLLGHSFGELAALAVGGAYSFETGLRIVCQRSVALDPLRAAGKMAAVSCGTEQAAKLIQAGGGKTLQIAVINHGRQTVISGSESELRVLGDIAASQGINQTVLRSRYPFHSALLEPALAPFRSALCSYTFRQPSIPVYLGTENKFYDLDSDLADVLSAQFVRQLDFSGILSNLCQSGYSRYIECGAGDTLTGIASKVLAGKSGLICRASAHPDTGVASGTAVILHEFAQGVPTRAIDPVRDLLQDVQSVLQRTTQLLEKAAAPVLDQPAAATATAADEVPAHEPIAIVSMGCVLPGARDPEEYWDHIMKGITGIVDPSNDDPSLAQDFLAGRNGSEITIVPDKTYTLLYGSVGTIVYDAKLLSSVIDETRFERLSRAEKLLTLASAQSLAGLKTSLAGYAGDRLQCILGATGDGCGEYDEALFFDSLQHRLQTVEPDTAKRAKFSAILNQTRDAEFAGTPTPKFQAVLDTVFGRAIRMYVVDAACSSSLYSIHLGMRALQNHRADAVLAAGVFAPGPANSALFAQFRGLTPDACRPLDEAADGVVFGHGSCVLVLKRLTDAVADGDRILGVVRAMGVSSDGKSPSINVPQSKGQGLAVRRAYEKSGIDVDTIQYVEAHATGTPVGDAVEFHALRESLPRTAGLPPIELGSIKSLVGHTGWAAGTASVIKLCKAFETRTVPGQYNFKQTGPEIPLRGSQFTISTTAHAWPENVAGVPRRAAINGFGFGGTNAHLVLEEYNPAYHKKLCGRTSAVPPAQLAVINWTSLFPARQELTAPEPSTNPEAAFDRRKLRLPKGKMLLPDVRDSMDPSQYLVSLAAEQVLAKISDQWPALRSEIGVVMGVEAKTQCGIDINQRIFLDRMRRRVSERAESGFRADALRILDQLSTAIKSDILPSGPYTLPGLMPNLVAGRVSQLFDLNGPNMVLDMGANSLFQSIEVAAGFLAHQECRIVLAGGINAARTSPEHFEGAFMMALTTPQIAKEFGLPVQCLVTIGENDGVQAAPPETRNYRGAHGIEEFSRALKNSNGQPVRLYGAQYVPAPQTAPPARVSAPAYDKPVFDKASFDSKWGADNSPYFYVQGTPIYYYTPVIVPTEPEAPVRTVSLRSRKLLFLTDSPGRWVDLERSGALDGLNFQVLGPMDSEEELTGSLDRLSGSFDTVVAVQSLDDSTGSSLLSGSYPALADLLFAVCKHSYTAIQEQRVWVATVSLNAFRAQHLDPHTGLTAGFLKALARELPDSVCRIVNTNDGSLSIALRQVEAEFARSSDGSEICYRGGKRHSIALTRMERLTDGSGPGLDKNSVVLATGGGRGVTAVLAEELLNRFGCTVIALGRTDPAAAPPHVLAMDEGQLLQYEAQFYKEQFAQGTGKKIIELKKQFKGYQSVLEVALTVRHLSGLPGRFEYINTDLTDGRSVAAIVESVIQKYGRVDLVVHGAGVQVSKLLPKKSLRDFQSVVSAKLESLRHIYQACRKQKNGGASTRYHILTSAFSYMGNDGQEDYGAANETLNRLAALMNDAPQGGQWTSVAWLGWAGIGMTRGLEYAALAAHRGLRGVTKEEGQKIFAELLDGRPTAPINVTLAAGELEFYKVKTVNSPAPAARNISPGVPLRNSIVIEREISPENAPYVWDHLVDGIPTIPGVLLIILIGEAALELRPNLKITAFEDTAFRRFVRIKSEGKTILRLQASVTSEDADSTLVRVAVVTDFIHKSGMILQKDVEQTAVSVRLARNVAAPPAAPARNGTTSHTGDLSLEDPYLMNGSPVKLDGPFRAMQNITAGGAERWADYRIRQELQSCAGHPGYRFLNLILLDSLVRFGGIFLDGEKSFPICVPEACRMIRIYYDFTNPDEKIFTGNLKFAGSNPLVEPDRMVVGPVEARDPAGRTLAMVDGAISRKIGEVRSGK